MRLVLANFAARFEDGHAVTIEASEIAREIVGRPLPNAAMLGAFAAVTGQLKIDSIQQAILERFRGKIGDANARAARSAFDSLSVQIPDKAG